MEEVKESNGAAVVKEPCPLCFGTGTEVVPGKGARPCECRKAATRARLFESARVPPRFRDKTFENFEHKGGSLMKAYNYAFGLVKNYPSVERGLLLMGTVGTGKTHLSAAIIRGLSDKGVPCLFYESGQLLREIQNSYNPASQTSELSILAPVFDAEVLILDELGAMKASEWVRDTLLQIIGTRYNHNRLTVITTNFLDSRADVKDETLEERVGPRLRSRLSEMCRTVAVEGEDYRRRFDR